MKKDKIKELITTTIGIFIGPLFVFGLIYLGYYIKGSDIEYKYNACDEYCFHHANTWGSETTGYLWNNSCICSDGSVGWFNR